MRTTDDINIEQVICVSCNGRGEYHVGEEAVGYCCDKPESSGIVFYKDVYVKCKACDGTGLMYVVELPDEGRCHPEVCPECKSKGTVLKKRFLGLFGEKSVCCPTCNGQGIIMKKV